MERVIAGSQTCRWRFCWSLGAEPQGPNGGGSQALAGFQGNLQPVGLRKFVLFRCGKAQPQDFPNQPQLFFTLIIIAAWPL